MFLLVASGLSEGVGHLKECVHFFPRGSSRRLALSGLAAFFFQGMLEVAAQMADFCWKSVSVVGSRFGSGQALTLHMSLWHR